MRKIAFLSLAIGLITVTTAIAATTKTVSETKEFQLYLDNTSTESEKILDLNTYSIPAPEECSNKNTLCEETVQVTINVEKTWVITTIASLDSAELESWEFAEKYSDLEECEELNDGSAPEDKFIAQRILYERGLLPVLPTGRIGYQTEKAVLELQALKDIYEYDAYRNIFYIGPETIRALNSLKDNLKDPEYLENNPLSDLTAEDLPEEYRDRWTELTNLIQSSNKYNYPLSSDDITIDQPDNNGEQLSIEGQAKIWK